MRATHIATLSVVFFACAGAQTVIKDVAAGAALVECIDEGIQNGQSAQIIAACGPDAEKIIEARRAMARKRNPCTTITSDAGPPTGPGR
jgi:hypothetical protein